MTACNKCGGRMVLDNTAVIPALGCVGCGRLIPRTAVKPVKADRAAVNRALRAARRRRQT
jgi:hypothetical protein